jgi:hypothetical protein
VQQHYFAANNREHDSSDSPWQADANLPQILRHLADQRHPERPANLHGLEVFTDQLAINGVEFSELVTHRLGTGSGPEKPDGQNELDGGRHLGSISEVG